MAFLVPMDCTACWRKIFYWCEGSSCCVCCSKTEEELGNENEPPTGAENESTAGAMAEENAGLKTENGALKKELDAAKKELDTLRTAAPPEDSSTINSAEEPTPAASESSSTLSIEQPAQPTQH